MMCWSNVCVTKIVSLILWHEACGTVSVSWWIPRTVSFLQPGVQNRWNHQELQWHISDLKEISLHDSCKESLKMSCLVKTCVWCDSLLMINPEPIRIRTPEHKRSERRMKTIAWTIWSDIQWFWSPEERSHCTFCIKFYQHDETSCTSASQQEGYRFKTWIVFLYKFTCSSSASMKFNLACRTWCGWTKISQRHGR